MLIFLAGYECDFRRVRGRPLRRAVLGWVASGVLALGVTVAFWELSLGAAVVALALTTTALGITLLAATGLPMIVVITTIGTERGVLAPSTAAALVGAGLLSVVNLLMVAMRPWRTSPTEVEVPPHSACRPRTWIRRGPVELCRS